VATTNSDDLDLDDDEDRCCIETEPVDVCVVVIFVADDDVPL
jgi:hypothetical protein